jgi:hypothetical protein
MLQHLTEADISTCERLLAAALRDVATELRLVDIGDLISYVRGANLANIRDLIASSCELYFRLGAWQFGDIAEAETPWDAPASIQLNLEFNNSGITVFLRLTLSTASASVELLGLHDAAGGAEGRSGAAGGCSQAGVLERSARGMRRRTASRKPSRLG